MHCNYDEIKSVISDKLKTSGFAKSTADNIAQGILLSEMSGETSHGLRLYYAVNQCVTNCVCVWGGVKLPKITASYAVVDCQYGVGLDSAKRCMDIAIKGAAENGIYTVFAHHANTFGAAFVYALQAVKQGMIGIVMANTPAQMPVYKGKQRLLGTNPLCYAIPAKDELPIIFDMASSAVAKSRINQAQERGETIPEGWGLDKDANPTTNPQEVLNGGFMLPFVDSPKGYGIAMMVDLFAGLLSGAACLDEVDFLKSGKMNVGQVFVAIDPTKIYGDNFYVKVDEYIRKIKASGDDVRLPGENKLKNILKAEKEGFEIDEKIYKQLVL